MDIEEEVSVVPIELGHVHIPLLSAALKSFFHRNDVIHVTFLNLKDGIESIRSINGVTCPGNVSEIIFLSLIEGKVNAETARFHRIDGIFNKSGIPVTGLIEGADDRFLVILIFFLIELLAAEEVINLGRLGLFH